MKLSLKKIFFKRRNGMNLVEIVVAIGVSVITLTTSAVFSTRLIVRAQQNFMEDSATQLTAVIVEELRLAEIEMQETRTKYTQGQPTVFPNVFANQSDWINGFCALGGKPNMAIDIPRAVKNTTQNFDFNISFLTDITNATVEKKNYQIKDITDQDQLTGAFFIASNSKLGVGILREVATNTLGTIITLSIVVRYYILNQPTPQYTRPVEVKMVKDTICV